MLRGMYAAASGMEANIVNQGAVSENLAHANVPGYRRQGAVVETFEPLLAQATAANVGAVSVVQGSRGALPPPPPVPGGGGELWGTRPSFIYTDWTQGPAQFTGNPFDLAAADASTFFVVDGPSGPLLTRNGTFTLDDLGQLITRSGLLVRGQAGRVVIPPETATLTFGPEGAVLADGVQIDTLLLADVPNPTTLVRVGDTLYQGPVPSGPAIPGTVRLVQGYVEKPNQSVVTDMVAMINGMRHYDAAQRALRSLSDAVAQNTRPQA